MSFEADFATHLLADSAIASAVATFGDLKCVWPGIRPERSDTPCVVFTVVFHEPVTDLVGVDNAGGGLEFYRIQTDCYAARIDDARALDAAVRTRLRTDASTFSSLPLPVEGPYDYEPDTKLHRYSAEFECYFTN